MSLIKHIILLTVLVAGCADNENRFYTENLCGLDCQSIALIEPCWLGSSTGENGSWYIVNYYDPIDNKFNEKGSLEVSHIDVLDSIIVGYFPYPNNRMVETFDTTWLINVNSEKKTMEFKSELKFDSIISDFNNNGINFTTSVRYPGMSSIRKMDTTWYIQIIPKQEGYLFHSEKEFQSKLSEISNEKIDFIDVKELAADFSKKGYAKWYPEKYKTQ